MNKILRTEKYFTALGYVLGAILGYIYFKMFPCTTGCALRSTPYATILFGTLLGGSVFQFIFERIQLKNKKNVKNNHWCAYTRRVCRRPCSWFNKHSTPRNYRPYRRNQSYGTTHHLLLCIGQPLRASDALFSIYRGGLPKRRIMDGSKFFSSSKLNHVLT